ncbi:hypothetical protein LEP1GSC165_2743 [Leptospira santarosai str. CBC523]|nr:hypothetical protein LEP1GSC165_2743 [Leptospira santarosai str. CBC523]
MNRPIHKIQTDSRIHCSTILLFNPEPMGSNSKRNSSKNYLKGATIKCISVILYLYNAVYAEIRFLRLLSLDFIVTP